MTTATRPAVTLTATIRGTDYTEDDARAAASVLAEADAGHGEAAGSLAARAALDGLANDDLEDLCAAFGITERPTVAEF